MYKKIILSCMAVVAFACFVLPAIASASNKPTLKDAEGVVKVGSKFWATNAGEMVFWNTATTVKQITCTKVQMTGEVTKNAEDSIEAKITTADVSGTGTVNADNGLPECTGSNGNFYLTILRMPLLLKSNAAMATDEFQLSGTGGNIRLLFGFTTTGECEYETTPSTIKGDFTTNEVQANLTIRDTEAGSGMKLIRGGFLCPSSYVLGMTLSLETETGAPIWIVKTP
jgi:hypothetical protein